MRKRFFLLFVGVVFAVFLTGCPSLPQEREDAPLALPPPPPVLDPIGGTVGPMVVTGWVGLSINARDITIILQGTEFSQDMAPGTVVNWIQNLPSGLTARVRQIRANETTGIITVVGTPTIPSSDILNIVIPAAAIRTFSPIRLVENVDTRFSINDNIRTSSFSAIGAGTSNLGWLGNSVGPLNVPMLPREQAFEGVGIVIVRATAVRSLRPDNEYHWSGETVNHGRLMEAAQAIGAHGIINVVIDYTDSVEVREVIRELPPEHVWSDVENIQRSRNILREVTRDGVRYVVQTTSIITRNYIGSALAIRYVR